MKTCKYWLMATIVFVGGVGSACARNTPTPRGIPQPDAESNMPDPGEETIDAAFDAFLNDMDIYNSIGIDTLNEMLDEEPPPFLLDVRSVEELEMNGYIAGAVVIPLRSLGQNTSLLPDFDTTIVSYCGSGWRCTIAMTALEALGWQDVLTLKGNSFGGWLDAGYPISKGVPEAVPLNAAQPDAMLLARIDETLSSIPEGWGAIANHTLYSEIVENSDILLIDVRRQEELVESGLIEGAAHIALESLIDDKANWPGDQDAKIVIYCRSGHRSTIAMTILWTYGYSDVRSLYGGIYGWLAAGYPVVEYALQ